MPMIDCRTTIPLSPVQKETLISEFGKSMRIADKPESFLMVQFQDNADLYFGGKKTGRAAYVDIKLFGEISSAACIRITEALSAVFERELDIPAGRLYITYQGIKDWGWNGTNF